MVFCSCRWLPTICVNQCRLFPHRRLALWRIKSNTLSKLSVPANFLVAYNAITLFQTCQKCNLYAFYNKYAWGAQEVILPAGWSSKIKDILLVTFVRISPWYKKVSPHGRDCHVGYISTMEHNGQQLLCRLNMTSSRAQTSTELFQYPSGFQILGVGLGLSPKVVSCISSQES